jgi:putative lipoic acid-binding regulatory protein
MAEPDRLLALLEANHRFPGPFFVAVMAVNEDAVGSAIRAAVREILDDIPDDSAWETRASSGGRYLSHRATVTVASAAEVLALFARLRAVPGVVTVL